MKTLSIGLVGVGRHGERYARHLLEGVPGLSLAAISRRDEQAGGTLARRFGLRFHREYQALVNDPSVEAVVVCTPFDLHARPALASIAARKPVLIEKPLSANAAEAELIGRAAAARNTVAVVAQTLRLEPALVAFRDALAGMGGARAMHVNLRSEDRNAGPDGRWKQDGNDGGALLDAGVHFFDLVSFLELGRISRLFASLDHALGYPVEDGFTALLETATCRLSIVVSRVGGSRCELIEALTPNGLLLLDRHGGTLARIEGRDRTPVPFDAAGVTLPAMLAAFRAAALGEAPNPVPIDAGIRTLRIADACRESHRRGGWVDLEKPR